MPGILGSINGAFAGFGTRNSSNFSNSIPISDLANWKTIGGGVTSATSGNYISLGRGGAQYQISSGKTLIAPGFYCVSDAATGDFIELGYADTALAGHNTATAPTSPIALWTPTSTVSNGFRVEGGTVAQMFWVPIPVVMPAQKYPYFRANATNGFHMLIPFKEV